MPYLSASNPRGVRLKVCTFILIHHILISFKPTRGSAESVAMVGILIVGQTLQTHEGFG